MSGAGVAAGALDQSHDLIVVLDDDGVIVLTNAAWRAGADLRGADSARTGLGVNYLEVCERSDAGVVAAGIRAVLLGDRPCFEFDYPRHSSVDDAWFALEVRPLGDLGSGAVVTHTNITARVAADRLHRHGRDVDPVTMLATAPAGVSGLAQVLAEAQFRGSSLAVATITLSDLAEIESLHGRRTRDEFVVQVVARVLRLTSADDAMIRASTNELVLFASVADAQGAEFLRSRISEVLEAGYLVGPVEIASHACVTMTASDQFSTLDSLLHVLSAAQTQPAQDDSAASDLDAGRDETGGNDADENQAAAADALSVPLMVYSLPGGLLQTANEAAHSLFGLKTRESDRLYARDITDPLDLGNTTAALSALSSGATDSYRARRTLVAADGPMALLTSVRRLLISTGALAVVQIIPVHPEETDPPAPEDPFSAALVAGVIDANGAIESVSSSTSPMESHLVDSLSETLTRAAHPDEADLVEEMLASLRFRGSSSGAFRLPHREQGWVVCQCQLFTIKQQTDGDPNSEPPIVDRDSFAFVLSANVSTRAITDRVARLERHIRRIGSEVQAADLALTVQSSVDRGVSAALDALALTARQRDIVERLARGQRVASIAAELYISRSTVRNHLTHVYRLVDVHSQEELLNALRSS